MITYPLFTGYELSQWLKDTITYLDSLQDKASFGLHFCRLHREFYDKFQGGYIFSTRFGATFFEDVLELITNHKFLGPVDGESKLGEYDENINKWLKIVYSRK